MKKVYKIITTLGLLTVLIYGVTGCGFNVVEAASTTEENESGVKKIVVAHTQAYVPYDYVDENGVSDGYEVAVLKAIDELLLDYEFEYVGTTDDDLLIGVESGKYDVGTKGVWWTEERNESYIFPKHYIGSSIIGITFRAEDADKIKDLKSFAQYSGNLAPIAPQNAQYNIIENYNEKNPDALISLVAADQFSSADAYQWVLEGRYDAYLDIRTSYESNIEAEDGEYHELASKLTYVTYEGIPTWPLFNKKNQELADAYDTAWETLKEDGTFGELSQKYFGYDLFEFIPDGYEKGDQL